MMTIIADTCGKHDTLLAACSAELNQVRYNDTGTASCQANFEHELARYGLGPRDVVLNVNFFMYAPIGAAGEVAVADGLSKPGDYVELRAEMDLLVVISNCPQIYNAGAGFNPTPVQATVYSKAG